MARNPSEEEAAAIAAAIERFRAETAPAADAGGDDGGPWLRAALSEGVGAKALFEKQGGERWPS